MSTSTSHSSPEDLRKSKFFLQKLKDLMDSPIGKGANLARSEIQITASASKALKLTNPKSVAVFATSMMVQKAMLAAGFATNEDKRKCTEALGNMAADFGLAAVLGPETGGLGAILPLAAALVDSYDMTTSCFHLQGATSHAVLARFGEGARTATETADKFKSRQP